MRRSLRITAALIFACYLFVAVYLFAKSTLRVVEFDQQRVDDIKQADPDIVLVGSSVLGSNVNREVISQELSNLLNRKVKVHFIWSGSTHSGFHFLVLKNMIANNVAIGTPVALISYEDYFLRPRDSRMRSSYISRRYQTAMFDDEPEFLARMGPYAKYLEKSSIQTWTRPEVVKRELIAQLIIKGLTSTKWLTKRDLFELERHGRVALVDRVLNRVLNVNKFRTDKGFEVAQPASPSNAKNAASKINSRQGIENYSEFLFLPQFAEFGKNYQVFLVNSPSNPEVKPAARAARRVSKPLSEYASAHGMRFIDMNLQPELQNPDLFKDSRHFKHAKAKELNSRLLAKALIASGLKLQPPREGTS